MFRSLIGDEPSWYPEKIMQIDSKEWEYRGRTGHAVRCHLQEIPENGADVAHLGAIHTQAVMLGGNLDFVLKFDHLVPMNHEWENTWQPSETDPHVAVMKMVGKNYVFGTNALQMDLSVRQIGPAIVHLEFVVKLMNKITLTRGVYIQGIKPISAHRHLIIHHLYTEPTFAARLFSKFLVYGEAKMVSDCVLFRYAVFNNSFDE